VIASVLTLNRAEVQALQIRDAYSIHRVVYSLFPAQKDETRDFLYADKGGDFKGRQVLLLSSRFPKPTSFGQLESKEIPSSFLDHDLYGFEVRLNPTRRDHALKKTLPVRGNEALVTWFVEKATANYGFEVLLDVSGVPSIQVKSVGVQRFRKGTTEVTHGEATFVGKLKVVDRLAFRKAFEEGLGRAKGFGFGLLQIVPLKN